MRRILFTLGLLLLPSVASATGGAHPRIWLDSTTLTRLTALKNANDQTWVNLKADADTYVGYTVDAYAPNTCLVGHICYTYQGSGWMDPLLKLSLAYKMTSDTTYSNKAIAIMDVMVAAGLPPEQVGVGYPSRNMAFGMGIAYDWCYDQLTPTEKSNYTALIDTWWAWVQTNGYHWAPTKNPYGNYFTGHFLGFGIASLAMEDDDANMLTIQTAIVSAYTNFVAPTITIGGESTTFPSTAGGGGKSPGGLMAGGYPMESYNYGGNTMLRYAQWMKAMQTAGKTDYFTANLGWMKNIAINTIYHVRPDLWSITDEGGWSGNFARLCYYSMPYDISGLLVGTTEGGYLRQLYLNFVTPPSPALPGFYVQTSWEAFLYNTGVTPVDYTAALPVYYHSPGFDGHTIVRTDWTTSAVHTTFNPDTITAAQNDHQAVASGHITIQRGSDYLLVTGGEWKGPTGFTGTPVSIDNANWHQNTLFYWDQATKCLSQTASSGQYAGCQMLWGLKSTQKHNEGTGFVFQEAPLRNAYVGTTTGGSQSTITDYVRSFVNINDVTFVQDRISAPSTSVRNLEWHTTALNTATLPGDASAITVSGSLATMVRASSKLWIKTLLPASPTINTVTDVLTYNVATQSRTQRFEVSDPAASSCSTNCLFLTILSATDSSASTPTMSLITVTNYHGALYDDGVTPRVAMFSSDGLGHTSVATYTASYSSGLTGRHVITDLTPGVYSVLRDGSTILTNQTVASDGSLSFTATGGTTWSISQTGATAPATNYNPATPVLFGNQTVNVTSGGQNIVLTNTGNANLTISSIAMQTGTQGFGVTNNCGGSVAALATCTITVTFTPTSVGAKSDNVVITSNAASSPDSVPTGGNGVVAQFVGNAVTGLTVKTGVKIQ